MPEQSKPEESTPALHIQGAAALILFSFGLLIVAVGVFLSVYLALHDSSGNPNNASATLYTGTAIMAMGVGTRAVPADLIKTLLGAK